MCQNFCNRANKKEIPPGLAISPFLILLGSKARYATSTFIFFSVPATFFSAAFLAAGFAAGFSAAGFSATAFAAGFSDVAFLTTGFSAAGLSALRSFVRAL